MRMFGIGREHSRNKEFNPFLRLYFFIFGAPEMGAKIRAKIAIKEIRKYPFTSLLDAGCGKGYISFWTAKHYPRALVVGVDTDSTKMASNKALKDLFHLSNLQYEVSDLLNLSRTRKYDLIVALDVLEHIEDDGEVLKSFRSSLSNGGKLILHVPKAKQLWFFKGASEYVVEDHVRPGYTEDELYDKLKLSGFKINQIIPTYSFFESLANQMGIIFSKNLLLYSIMLPFLYILSFMPQGLLRKENHISNTLLIVAEPAL